MFIKMLFTDPRTFAASILIVVFSICLHEFLHAWVALKMGDPTAADHGHLTMNPFKQMGFISLIMLCFIGLAWGQVPVNPYNLNTRKKRIAVSLAGVTGNLFLVIAFSTLALLVFCRLPQHDFAIQMLTYGAVINMVLFIINIMPIPGFDGFNVLREYIRIDNAKTAEKANVFFFVLAMLLFIFIDTISGFATKLVFRLIQTLANVLGLN